MDHPGRRLRVARVLGPHGVKGQVRLEVFLEDPDLLGTLGTLWDAQGRPVALAIEGRSGKAFIARITGIDSRDSAEALGKMALYAARSALPETARDEFYEADLVGLSVVEATGTVLGQVVALADFGAGPLIEVQPTAGGRTVFLPFTAAVVPEVDVAGRQLRVALSPGLWPARERTEP